jgi:putative sterol carrier protein
VRLGAADFVRLVAGSLDPIVALRDNRLEVEGDVVVAARMDEMFGGGRLL